MGAQRRQAWYVEEGAERPVLLEVIRLRRAGLSSLDARPLELPLMSQAAVLLTGLSPRERQFRLIPALLDVLFDPDSDRWIKGAPHREAGSLLLGHHDITNGLAHETRREEAAKPYHQGVELFRNVARGGQEAPLIRLIAAAIENILTAYRSSRSDQSRETSSLIERETYVTKLLALALVDNRPIYIWGEPGTGKTVLADQASRRLAGDNGLVLILRCGNSDVLEADVTEALMAEGMEPTNWTDAYSRAALKRRLTTGGELPRCACVVVDNIDDEELLHQIIPAEPAVPVLVTMRSKPTNQSSGMLELHDFSEEQACAFLRTRIKSSSESEIHSLARVLGYRPLALDHAVRFVNESPNVDLPDLVEVIAKSVTTGLMVLENGPSVKVSLIGLYKLMLAEIIKYEDARLVLDAFLGITGNSGLEARHFLQYFMASEAGGSVEDLQFAAGVRILSSYGILREISGGEATPIPIIPYLSMHSLTFEIMRDLRVSALGNLEGACLLNLWAGEHDIDNLPKNLELGGTLAWVYSGIISAIEDSKMPEGWMVIHRIDDKTWTAFRRIVPSEGWPIDSYPARYEVYPNGIYELEYRTDTRRPLSADEVKSFEQAVSCYMEAREFLRRNIAAVTAHAGRTPKLKGEDFVRIAKESYDVPRC